MSMRGLRVQATRSNSLRNRNSSVVVNDENSIRIKTAGKGPPVNVLKDKMQSKRKADSALQGNGIKKRSTFGDITNAIEKTLKDSKKDLKKPVAQKTKLSGNSFKVLRNKTVKGKENENKITTGKENGGKEVTVNTKQLKKVKKTKPDICDSLPSTHGLLTSSKTPSVDTSNYMTASEGSPIISIFKSIEEEVETRLKIRESLSPPAGVEDYDQECGDDVFAVSIYAMDIFKYYREREKCFLVEKYMSWQTDISKTMRAILVDWMVEVQESFELNHETLYLAVKLVDYYLTKVKITRDTLQLVGSTSLFIACKFDERIPPYADDFLFICDNAYKKEQLFAMEIKILKTINYDLGIPLSYRFLRRYARCCKLSMEDLTLARYILERSLMEYDLIDSSDSALAAAALLLSRAIKKDPTWTPVLEYYSGYKMEDIYHLVHVLHNMVLGSVNDKHKTIKTKYSHKVFYEVATIPVPEELGL